ncbi:MAG TPA: serine/threonine-protein kinase [Burkholderiaceae bacterium]|nr:serine/threonine-protein kinase [Burkholderiaceae bacterium]
MTLALLPLPRRRAKSGAARPPARIGPYEIEGQIGEGAMGVVWRARDPRLDRLVALKTIRKSLLRTAAVGSAATVRLRHEAQAAARLSHPGIVSVYEYGEDGEQAWIAMEFVLGTPLAAAIVPSEPLPVDDVLCLVVQLLAALQNAHEQGVWHRDIKPANLMITREGRLKITDFGIARIDAVALTQDAKVMGSPGYMAPECYRGAGVDHRADLYAVGVLLYELLAGARPFRGAAEGVMHATLTAPAPPLPDSVRLAVDEREAFDAVVQRALAKAPEDRYLSALEMRHELMFAAARPIPNTLSVPAMRLLGVRPGSDGAPAPTPVRAAAPLSIVPTATVADVFAVVPAEPVVPVASVVPVVPSVPVVPKAATVAPEPDPLRWTALEPEPASPPPEPAPLPRVRTMLASAALAPPSPAAPPVPAFESAWIDAVSALLAEELGPIAHVLARRAAASGARSASALVLGLANDALPPARRQSFIERARALLRSAGDASAAHAPAARSPAPPTGTALPLLGADPLDAAPLDSARALLAQRLGPIAALLVRRAAASATTREQFIERLAALACEDDAKERARLVAALCRLR